MQTKFLVIMHTYSNTINTLTMNTSTTNYVEANHFKVATVMYGLVASTKS